MKIGEVGGYRFGTPEELSGGSSINLVALKEKEEYDFIISDAKFGEVNEIDKCCERLQELGKLLGYEQDKVGDDMSELLRKTGCIAGPCL